MRARRRSSAILLVTAGALLLGSGAVTATLGVPRGMQDGVVVFAAPGADAFGLSVAASTDSRWRPAPGDWHTGGGRRYVLPLTADGGPLDLQPGGGVVIYLFVRNASEDLAGEVTMIITAPAQGAKQDEFFDHIRFHGAVEGRTIFDGTGRVDGVVDRDVPAGGVRRVILTVRVPADTPSLLLDRTTGVLVRVHAENR